MHYFAYGSNCNPAVMERKGVRVNSARHAVLPGYKIVFNKLAMREYLPPGIGYANIQRHPTDQVEGILYDVVDEHRERLDDSERYPEHYTRIELTVRTPNELIRCDVYQAQPDKISDGLAPTRDYLDHLLAAGEFFSLKYLAVLENHPTFMGLCSGCRKTAEVVYVHQRDRRGMFCQSCRPAGPGDA